MLYGIGQSLLSSLAEISVSTVTVFSLDIGYCSSSLEICLLNIEITLTCGLYRRIHNHLTSSDSELKEHYILSWKDTAKNQYPYGEHGFTSGTRLLRSIQTGKSVCLRPAWQATPKGPDEGRGAVLFCISPLITHIHLVQTTCSNP